MNIRILKNSFFLFIFIFYIICPCLKILHQYIIKDISLLNLLDKLPNSLGVTKAHRRNHLEGK
jgi:hypothetical protein